MLSRNPKVYTYSGMVGIRHLLNHHKKLNKARYFSNFSTGTTHKTQRIIAMYMLALLRVL